MTNWQQLTIYEQMANIGSEVNRIFAWQQKKKVDLAKNAAKRATGLVDETMADPKNQQYQRELNQLKELIREFVGDSDTMAQTKPQTLINFFLAYGLAVRS